MSKMPIFTASTGGGHNQVAMVLKNEFAWHGHNVEVHDFLKESNRFLNMVLADGYNHLAASSFPLFGLLYKTSDNENVYKRLHRLLNIFLADRIRQIIIITEPDLIVVTHPMIVNVLGDLKARGHINIPIMSVVTDFDVHQSYICNHVDAYIAAGERTGQYFY